MGAVAPSPDDLSQVPAIRTSALVAAVAWAGLHLALAVLSFDQVRHPLPYVAALALCGVGVLWTIRPLLGDPARVPDLPVWLMAASVPVVELLDVSSLEPGAVNGYANWPAGATGVLLAGLVLRRRGWWAIVATVGLVTVQTVGYLRSPAGEVELAIPVLLAFPSELWLLGSWAVRRLMLRADRVAVEFRLRAANDAAAALAGGSWQDLRAERLDELEARVLPFLADVADGRPVNELSRVRARALADELRDGLRARNLLDRQVREVIAQVRAVGVRVLVSSDLDDGPEADGLRRVLPALLRLTGLESAAVRVQVDPIEATCVLTGELDVAEVGTALGGLGAPWSRTGLVPVESGLVLSLGVVG